MPTVRLRITRTFEYVGPLAEAEEKTAKALRKFMRSRTPNTTICVETTEVDSGG